jgi:hypothetical protein
MFNHHSLIVVGIKAMRSEMGRVRQSLKAASRRNANNGNIKFELYLMPVKSKRIGQSTSPKIRQYESNRIGRSNDPIWLRRGQL